MKAVSRKEILQLAEMFRCDSLDSFLLAFGINPMAVVEICNMLVELVPESTEPLHLLLVLNSMTDTHTISGLPVASPPTEEYTPSDILAVGDAIRGLYDSIMPPVQTPTKVNEIKKFNGEMGLKLEPSTNPLRQRLHQIKFFKVLSTLKHLDSQRGDSASTLNLNKISDRFNLNKISDRWRRVKECEKHPNPEVLFDELKSIAVLEHLHNTKMMKMPTLSAADFQKAGAKLTGNSKLPFESIFFLPPEVCAEAWNYSLPLKAKPKHLLGALIVLQDRDDAPFYFAENQMKSNWIQRILRPLAARYAYTVVS
jgi:hypothetical protein